MIRSILLGLSAAVAAGLLFVNLYNSLVDAPNWGADLPTSITVARQYFSVANPGSFFRIVSPVNQILALVGVVLCWRTNRYLALGSLVLAVVADAFTFGFFYPRNEIMFINDIDINAIQIAWKEWSTMNWLRTTICAANTVLAFLLLVLTSKRPMQ
jgi:hypothetical protein